MARYRLQEWLNFTTSEIHKTYSPLFNPAVPEEYKTMAKAKLLERYRWVDGQLEGKSYLLGDAFSVADAYLFTVTNWAKHVGLDLSGLKNVGAFMARVACPAGSAGSHEGRGPAEVDRPCVGAPCSSRWQQAVPARRRRCPAVTTPSCALRRSRRRRRPAAPPRST